MIQNITMKNKLFYKDLGLMTIFHEFNYFTREYIWYFAQESNLPIHRALHQPVKLFKILQNTTYSIGRFFSLKLKNQLYGKIQNQISQDTVQVNWR
jgi:hypothetical protein